MNWINGRPDGWKLAGVEAAKPINLVPDDVRRMLSKDAYEQGASAMLSALLKWLDEPCDKHWVPELRHRRHCDKCWAELEGKHG